MKSKQPSIETKLRRRERRRSFLLFFSIVLGIYGLINFYIFVRLDVAIPVECWFRPVFLPLFLFIALAFLAGELLEHQRSTAFGTVLTWIGAFWLGAITWFLLAFAILDFAKLILGLLSLHYLQGREATQWITILITCVIFVAMLLGFLNARRIRIKPLSIKIEKPCPPLRIAAISDMHMGTLIGRRMVRQMVRKINSIRPDLVLMVGDQVDGNPRPVMQRDLGSELKKIESKYGVFAITGNHEYIGNAETSCAYLEAHGITMLRDKAVEIAGVYLIG
ncbi:MAG TPA: metallophosphoesterase, partial [Candidatus Kapabacteria bacterium]|nr:metallophosphoesterase [Candidatus Kapabacteria bacterium]